MKTVLICLLLITKFSVEAIPYTYTPCDVVYIHQGTPLVGMQDPLWIAPIDKIVCPNPIIKKTTKQFEISDHNTGHYYYPTSQLSGFVQARPQVAGAQ
jgi:hypothetical protein